MLYDGEHRSQYSACLIENHNTPRLRIERGKYQQRAFMKFIFEDLPAQSNGVSSTELRNMPQVEFYQPSNYATDAIRKTKEKLNSLLSPLPVEHIEIHDNHPTEGHILGTVRMGNSTTDSLVDNTQTLFQARNVLSLGGSSFPTLSPANPTLTIAALSLRSAEKILQ
jgi:choline dehydrogenase-like flavoprotein